MSDGAGEVVAVGPAVDSSVRGPRDGRVSPRLAGRSADTGGQGRVAWGHGDGWLQQYRVAPVTGLVPTPDHLTDLEAATLPCAGVTAWSACMEANIGAGDVIVTQGTGGVSLFAVQLARALGAT